MFLPVLMIDIRKDKAMNLRKPKASVAGDRSLNRMQMLHAEHQRKAVKCTALHPGLFAVCRKIFQVHAIQIKDGGSKQFIVQIKNMTVYLVFYRDFPFSSHAKKAYC